MNEIDLLQSSNINDVCRLCANIDDNMVSIYSDEGADHMLENKIKTHLPFINICENDVLPKKICYQCASTVLVWNELYELCSNANKKLKYVFEFSQYEDSNKDMETEPHDMETEPHDIETEPHVIETEPHIIETEPHIIETEPHIIETEPHVIETLSGSDDKRLIEKSVVFQEVIDDHLFNDEEKSLNQLDKNPGTSNVQNQEHKSPIIQEDEILSAPLKRYISMTESDSILKIISTKEPQLINNYCCSFCPETFVKIRDRMIHDRDIHGVSNTLPINKLVSNGYYNTNYINILNCKEKNTNQNLSSIVDVNDSKVTQVLKKTNFLCGICKIYFKTAFEKLEHDQKLHNMNLVMQQSKHVSELKDNVDIFDEFDIVKHEDPLNSVQIKNKDIKSYTIDKESDFPVCIDPKADSKQNEPIEVESDFKKVFNCYYCNERFSTKYLALKHIRLHTVNDKKAISKSDEFDKYKIVIDNKLYYKCDQCNYAVERRKYKFVYHMRVHTGEKPYTCEICSKKFRTAAFLRRHVVCFHERVRSYQCDICGRSFSEKRNVDDHRRTHTGERPFVCETCGKSFAQRSSMKIHWKQMHESIKSHKCEYCDKSFIRRCHLVAHLTHHTGIRNYVCSICGKAFLRSGTLKGHTSVHSSERPFKCTICGDSFKLNKHLKQHGRVHGNSQSYRSTTELEHTPATLATDRNTNEVHNN